MANEFTVDDDVEVEVKGDIPGTPTVPDIEIEIEDDTPPQDRDRKAAPPPAELTDEEMATYSDNVKQRLRHFTKGYHDERRAKEQAVRETQHLQQLAQKLLEENSTLKGSVTKNQGLVVEQAKRTATAELEAAKKEFRDAHAAGDSDAVLVAQEALTTAKIKLDRLGAIRVPPLQQEKTPVQQPARPQPQAPVVDSKAAEWAKKNTWFDKDTEMTGFAYGLHNKLVREEGIDPRSDEYYAKIDKRMREVFPDRFKDSGTAVRKESPVVAPATRSTAPRKVKLTKSEVAVANRLGVPLAEYARMMVANRDGGVEHG